MNYEIKEYNELTNLFNKFQIVETTGLLFIPENINNSKDFIYSGTTTDLKKVFEDKQQIDYLNLFCEQEKV